MKTPAIATVAAALSVLMMASANAQFRNFPGGPIPFVPLFGPRDEPPPDISRRQRDEPPPAPLMRNQRDQQPQGLQGRGQRVETPPRIATQPRRVETPPRIATQPPRVETPPVAPANTQRSEPVAAAVALMQLNMEAIPRLTPDGVRKVQQLLKDRGLNPGLIDGVAGPLTNAAIRSFQEGYGIKVRGDIDNQTLFALGATDLAGEAN